MLVAENVKALRKLLPVLEAEYGKAGYKCHAQLFNSKYWGVPQNRERYIVVGTLDSLPDTYTYPEEQHDYVPKLSTILEADVDDKFYIADEKAHKIIDQALQRISSMGKVHATITLDRVDKRQNERRSKEDEDPMFTLTAQDLHGVILRPERTEYGKSIRKEYESGNVEEKRGNMRTLQPRPDNISNTLTSSSDRIDVSDYNECHVLLCSVFTKCDHLYRNQLSVIGSGNPGSGTVLHTAGS